MGLHAKGRGHAEGVAIGGWGYSMARLQCRVGLWRGVVTGRAGLRRPGL